MEFLSAQLMRLPVAVSVSIGAGGAGGGGLLPPSSPVDGEDL